jgi:hypothetical protein
MAATYPAAPGVTAASWMAPDGTIYDVGRGGHQSSAINAFTKSGLWSENQARASYHLGFHGPNEFVEYGFVRMYALNDANEFGFEMSSPDELTDAQRERLATEALKAYANGWRVVAGHSDRRLDLRRQYSEEDIRKLLGIVERHYGPGPHPGTGTPQSVHGGNGKTVRLPDDKKSLARLRKQAKERQAEGKFANVTRDPKTGEYMLITDRETAVEDTGDKIRNLNREQLYYFNAYELFYHKQGDSDSVDIDALEMGDLRGFGQEAHWHGDTVVSIHNHPPTSGWVMPPSPSDLKVAVLTFAHEMRVSTNDGDYIVKLDKFGKRAANELSQAFGEYNDEVLPKLFPEVTKEMSPRAQRQHLRENNLYEELKQFQLDRLDAISEELPWVSYEYRPTN